MLCSASVSLSAPASTGAKGTKQRASPALALKLREFFLRVFDHGGLQFVQAGVCVARHVVVLDQAKPLTGLLVRVSRKLGHESFEKRAQKLKCNAYVHNVEPVHLYAVHSYKGRAEKGTHLRRRQQSLPRTLPVSRLQLDSLETSSMRAGVTSHIQQQPLASFLQPQQWPKMSKPNLTAKLHARLSERCL